MLTYHPLQTVAHIDRPRRIGKRNAAQQHDHLTGECPDCGGKFNAKLIGPIEFAPGGGMARRGAVFCDHCAKGNVGLFRCDIHGRIGSLIRKTRIVIHGQRGIDTLLTRHPDLVGVEQA